MNNYSYWKARANELEKIREQMERGITTALIEQYKSLAKEMSTYIESLLYDITDVRGNIIPSDIYKYNKQVDFFNTLTAKLKELGAKQQLLFEDSFAKLYSKIGNACAETLGLTYQPDQALINNCINAIWCDDGLNWSQRLYRNNTEVANAVYNGFLKSISTGESIKQLPRQIATQLGVGLTDATRLVRTELTHIQNTSAMDRYKEAGVDRYRIISFSDSKRCDKCDEMNGRIYRMDEYNEGHTAPPHHPNCRCSIIPLPSENF